MTAPTNSASPRKIVFASFSTTTGAAEGLDRLKNAGVRLGNAAIVTRTPGGDVEFKETQDWGIGKSAAVGALAAILLPGIGLFVGALAGGVAAHFIDLGFPDALLRQLGSGIDAGTSLLIALVDEADTALAAQTLSGLGGTVLGSGLEADLAKAIESLRNSGGATA